MENIFLKNTLKIRKPQIEMINHCEKSLEQKNIAIIEAPTATGKSLAYLLAIHNSNKKKKKPLQTVISTATIALQSQLIEKDLPFFKDMIQEDITYVVSKGRRNYLCISKFHDAEIDSATSKIINKNIQRSWNGDIDNLAYGSLNNHIWLKISSTSSSCAKKNCSNFDECFYYKAKRKIWDADYIITNHSMLLSSLAIGDGSLLPKMENVQLVLDECHHLPKKSLSAFSLNVSINLSFDWIDKAKNILDIKNTHSKLILDEQIKEFKSSCGNLYQHMLDIQVILKQFYMSKKQNDFEKEFILDEIIDTLKPSFANCILYSNKASLILSKITKVFTDKENENFFINEQSMIKHTSEFNFYIEKFTNITKTWKSILSNENPPIAKWLHVKNKYLNDTGLQKGFNNIHNNNNTQEDFTLLSSPITAKNILKKYLWDNLKNGTILCSATVRSVGKFDYFIEESGLKLVDDKDVYLLESPLEYKNSNLIIPNLQHMPTNSESFHIESANYIKNLCNQEKTSMLVLFTSFYSMNFIFKKIEVNNKYNILMQGLIPKNQILAKHKHEIDNGKISIIFGLDSFSEGIDLPGDYLKTLVIHKIPFTVPSEPVQQCKAQWIESQNLNFFMKVSLAEASMKLTQMVGRLIRREDDIGRVIILDVRIKRKFYGKFLLNNLPKFNIE